jgi:hypothetical protein
MSSARRARMMSVFNVLLSYPGNWLSCRDVQSLTGQSQDQVYRAVADIKDSYPNVPLAMRGGVNGGYRMTADEDALSVYRHQTFGYIATMVSRYATNLDKELTRIAGIDATRNREVQIVRTSLARLVQDVSLLV